MDRFAAYWKAIVGFITPGAVVIGSSVMEGSDGGSRITAAEIVTALVACIVTSGAVYVVPNKGYTTVPATESDYSDLPIEDTHGGLGESGQRSLIFGDGAEPEPDDEDRGWPDK